MAAGRPRLILDETLIRKLAEIDCTMGEIAACLKCSIDTLERNYAGVINQGREQGKSSLRRAQYKKAMEGNPTMLIWLGKHRLGQKDEFTVMSEEPNVRRLLKRWDNHTPKGPDPKDKEPSPTDTPQA
jgi:hypothetical protein